MFSYISVIFIRSFKLSHVLGIESDIHAHFEELAAHDILPSLEDLLEQGTIL